MTDNITTPFDYQGLAEDAQEYVRRRTEEIRTLAQRSAQDIRDIGIKLIEVKGRIGHGRFGLWLQAEFGWSDRLAQKFINVATTYKNENFSDLTIAPSALYLLSAPSTPKTASDEATKRAKAGEKITHGTAKKIIADHKRVITPPPAPVTVADPNLSWEEQYFEQIDARPNEVVFLIPGDRATMWIALGNTAAMVAEKTGTQTYPLAGGLPGIPAIPMVCVTITDPQTGKEDAAKVADLEELLGRRTVTYVESDIHLLALLRDTTKFTIEPTKILTARRDQELAAQAARQPFAAPTPGMPAQRPAAPVQFPPTGWRSTVTHVEPVQTSLIDLANGSANHTEIIEGEATEMPALPEVPALPPTFADSTALIAFVAQCIDTAELAIKHFGQQPNLTDEGRIDLDVIEKNFWGAGQLGDKLHKMLIVPMKLQEARDIFALAQDVEQVEKAIGIAAQLKVGHGTKDQPVMEFLNQAQARLMELRAA